MGWLKDYMLAVEPPIPSFGQLAQTALAHPAWPADTQPKPRSLATLFSKLDRAQDMDWLRDRLAVQQVLAELLHRPLADLRLALGEVATPSDDRFLRLDDVRFAREIDLAKDPLPPGIPCSVYDPLSWAPSWWVGPPGAGKTITGLWLKCRGLAHPALVSESSDLGKLPPRGPLYLELSASFDTAQLTREVLVKLRAETRRILIASAAPPPANLKMELIESPPTLSYLPELVDWVAEHLDGSGHLRAERAEQWLRQVAIPGGAIHSWGDTLGLIGMLDEVHPRSLLAKSLDEIGEHFVSRRVREASDSATSNPRLAQDAYPALLDCAASCLISGQHSLDQEYDLDIWTSLLSTPQSENVPDPAWFTSALSSALGNKVARRDLARAARHIQPSAFALARALSAAQILIRSSAHHARHEHGALRKLRPRWLSGLLTARAATQLVEYSSLDWGQVLLAGKEATRVIHSLTECAARGQFAPFAQLIDDFDSEQAQCVAALEGATIAAGLAQLQGHEIPDEIAEELLNLSAEVMVLFGAEIRARFTQPSQDANLFTTDYWVLALSSLCQENRFIFPHWDPFRTTNVELVQFVLSTIERSIQITARFASKSLDQARQDKQLAGQLHLLGELYETHHRLLSNCGQDAIAPVYLRLVHTWTDAGALYESLTHVPLAALFDYAESLGQKRSEIIGQLWIILAEEPQPDRLFPTSELRAALWSALPPHILSQRITSGHSIDWSHIRPHQFAEVLRKQNIVHLPNEGIQFCPLDLVLDLVGHSGPLRIQSAALRQLMQRAPARFAPLVRKHLHDITQFRHLLESCPANATATFSQLFPTTEELMRLPAPIMSSIRSLLHRAVSERHPNFEICYQKLAEIEQKLRPLRKIP